MDESYIVSRITELRMKKGVSARDMSLSLGQSESYINTIENKRSLPSITLFLYICEYFDSSPMEFFDEGNKYPTELADIVKDLKKLNGETLGRIAHVIKDLANK